MVNWHCHCCYVIRWIATTVTAQCVKIKVKPRISFEMLTKSDPIIMHWKLLVSKSISKFFAIYILTQFENYAKSAEISLRILFFLNFELTAPMSAKDLVEIVFPLALRVVID